jgi:hypothetical protein
MTPTTASTSEAVEIDYAAFRGDNQAGGSDT